MNNKDWFSAKELAGLPGMPGTDRSIRRLAARDDYKFAERTARGGTYCEYHISSLPTETRIALATKAVVQIEDGKSGIVGGRRLNLQNNLNERTCRQDSESGLATYTKLSVSAKQRTDAKIAIISEFEEFRKTSGINLEESRFKFSELYCDGSIEIDPSVFDLHSTVSPQSLRRWSRQLKKDGLSALAGQYGNRKGTSRIDSQDGLREFTLSMLVEYPHANPKQVMRAIRARFKDRDDVELPAMRSLQRWIANWKKENKQLFAAVSNPDKWKNEHLAAFGSASEDVIRLNQRWELDSTPADVMLSDGRHSIIGVIDIYSRRLKLLVSKTSTAVSIASLIRIAILEWGVPESAKTDRGKDYVSHHVVRVFSALETEHLLCDPFQGQQKPHIERTFRTFSHDGVELLGNYIGHNVADRKAIDARQSFADRLMKKNEVIKVDMSAEEFQSFCNSWVDNIYHMEPHSGLGGKSPFEMISGYQGDVRTIGNERALDILLAEAPGDGWRTVGKKGIRLDGFTYIHADIGPLVGERVHVRYDVHDIGRVYVFGGGDVQFICVAECPEIIGEISRQEIAVHAREKQKVAIQDARRKLKAVARKAKTKDIVNEILALGAREANKLAQFPARTVAHESEGLTAAMDAASPSVSSAKIIKEDDLEQRRQDLIKKTELKNDIRVFDSQFDRAWWLECESRERDLLEEEIKFLKDFRRENSKSAHSLDALVKGRFNQQEIQ